MLKIHKAGMFTTIQDRGRLNYRDKGVPTSGAMDSIAFNLANTLLANPQNASVLEITMMGGQFEFLTPTFFVITGAIFNLTLNSQPITPYKVYAVKKGDLLVFKKLISGVRAYLAVKGGFQSSRIMESYSMYFPITKKTRLEKGDTINYLPQKRFSPILKDLKIEEYWMTEMIEVFRGPEWNWLTTQQQLRIINGSFTVAMENSRMGYQLAETIPPHTHSMITSATLTGTVQCTPAGKLIVLMKDGPTTGGYPRVLQLTENAVAVLAQKKYNDTVRFELR